MTALNEQHHEQAFQDDPREVYRCEYANWRNQRYDPANLVCQRAFDVLPALGSERCTVRLVDGRYVISWENYATDSALAHSLQIDALLDPASIQPWNLERLSILSGQSRPNHERRRRFGLGLVFGDKAKDRLLRQMLDEVPAMVALLEYRAQSLDLIDVAEGVVARPFDPGLRPTGFFAEADDVNINYWRQSVAATLNSIDTATCVGQANEFMRFFGDFSKNGLS